MNHRKKSSQCRAARRRKKKVSGSDRDAGGQRNWADLPADVLSIVFPKLSVLDVLFTMQRVCRNWNVASHNPAAWRVVDMRGYCGNTLDMEKVSREAIRRAAGCLEEYCGEYSCSDDLLSYIAERAGGTLKCLRLMSCYNVSGEGLIEFAKKSTMLEELEITISSLSGGVYESLGQLCPKLKHFRLNSTRDQLDYGFLAEDWTGYRYDAEALAIANTMQQLHSLQLVGNQLTNKGLVAILDNCTQLEYLDIRRCYNVKIDESISCKLNRIKNVRLPHDSTDDYEYFGEEDDVFSDIHPPHFDYDDYIAGEEDYFEYDDYFYGNGYFDDADDLGIFGGGLQDWSEFNNMMFASFGM